MPRWHCWYFVGTKRGKTLKGSLLRAFLLLVAIGLVAAYGVRGSLNPAHVTTVNAADLQIVLTSNDTETLQFQVAVGQPCADALAPGDSCFATVNVKNAGSIDYPVGAPQITVNGSLNTCTGDDPNSPGTGGHNLKVSFSDPQPGSQVLAAGASETFDVVFTLDSAIGNACQGKDATIQVTVDTGWGALSGATPVPTVTAEPTVAATEEASPPPETPAEEPFVAQAHARADIHADAYRDRDSRSRDAGPHRVGNGADQRRHTDAVAYADAGAGAPRHGCAAHLPRQSARLLRGFDQHFGRWHEPVPCGAGAAHPAGGDHRVQLDA